MDFQTYGNDLLDLTLQLSNYATFIDGDVPVEYIYKTGHLKGITGQSKQHPFKREFH